jgi:plastocyanin
MRLGSVFLRSSLLVLSSLIFFNGCSSSSSKETNAPSEMPEEKITPSLYVVQIEQMKFFPDDITVHKGDTIMWINNDMVAHDVTEIKDSAWSSSLLQPGKSWRLIVDSSADYYCSIHKVMKGSFEIQ